MHEKSLPIHFSDSFHRDYKKFIKDDPVLKSKLTDYLTHLQHGTTISGMNLEPIKGFPGVKSIRLSGEFRISLSYDGDGIRLHRAGHHDDLYRSPL